MRTHAYCSAERVLAPAHRAALCCLHAPASGQALSALTVGQRWCRVMRMTEAGQRRRTLAAGRAAPPAAEPWPSVMKTMMSEPSAEEGPSRCRLGPVLIELRHGSECILVSSLAARWLEPFHERLVVHTVSLRRTLLTSLVARERERIRALFQRPFSTTP